MKLSQIEQIAQKMLANCYSEDNIIEDIKAIKNLEQVDRDGRTLLINAAFYNCPHVIEYLIEHKVKLNAKDKVGYTALHAASQEGNIEIVEMLLKNGVDVNATNFFGNSPLMVVRMIKEPLKIISLLLSYGADPYQKNNYGNSAADVFASKPEIADMLGAK